MGFPTPRLGLEAFELLEAEVKDGPDVDLLLVDDWPQNRLLPICLARTLTCMENCCSVSVSPMGCQRDPSLADDGPRPASVLI